MAFHLYEHVNVSLNSMTYQIVCHNIHNDILVLVLYHHLMPMYYYFVSYVIFDQIGVLIYHWHCRNYWPHVKQVVDLKGQLVFLGDLLVHLVVAKHRQMVMLLIMNCLHSEVVFYYYCCDGDCLDVAGRWVVEIVHLRINLKGNFITI